MTTKTVMLAIFDPSTGIRFIQEGKEDEFFNGMSAEGKEGLILMNSLGVVALEVMDEFKPIIVPPSATYQADTTDSLKASIEACGGDYEKVVEEARGQIKELGKDGLIQLCLLFMR